MRRLGDVDKACLDRQTRYRHVMTKKILKKELPDAIRDEGGIKVVMAPTEQIPKGLPAAWSKVLRSNDPVRTTLEEIWHPWQQQVPRTIEALQSALRGIALLQTGETAASLLYVFEDDGERFFHRGYRSGSIKGDTCGLSAKELSSRLPAKFLDLYKIHDGWPDGLGVGLLPSRGWFDLTCIYDDDELSEVVPGVPLEDFLVVWEQDSRYLGFDMTKKRPRCLAWEAGEPHEVVPNIVTWLDEEWAQQIADFSD
ncbi:MAG: hypothetical protein JRH20_13490 [Deltaproteobacteria bacterium]|nr:hypothetical protein [Deltaproteobacteria bacterium]